MFSHQHPHQKAEPYTTTHHTTPLTHHCPLLLSLSSFLYPSFFTLHPSLFTLHPSPFTLHPSSFTLHPSPFTLALHPSPFTLRRGSIADEDRGLVRFPSPSHQMVFPRWDTENHARQNCPHAHMVLMSRDQKTVRLCRRGARRVYQGKGTRKRNNTFV